jgi:predicted nucleotidyltransferase component of viral defense system
LIQRAYITAWRSRAAWLQDSQVEQDLVLSRALVELFDEEAIAGQLAFRGGTALHKLYLTGSQRYSEDIDLVQVNAGAIGPILSVIHRRLDSWLGMPQWKQGAGRVTLYYRFNTEIEPIAPTRLKLEINTREHFTVLNLVQRRFEVNNGWFNGTAEITTYELDELLGTKLRALYQRKKGRDLFDLWAASRDSAANPKRLVECFERYVEHDGLHISRAEFESNLYEKLRDPGFGRDVEPLLASSVDWDQAAAAAYVFTAISPLLSGSAWKGDSRPSK